MNCSLLLACTLIATFQTDGKLIIKPSDTDVRKNHSTHFNCSTDIGSTTIFWFHGENYIFTGVAILEPYTERFSVDQYVWNGTYNFNLVIHSVQPGDAGQYVCSDDEVHGEKYSVQLVVLDDDPICRSNKELNEVIGQNACNIEPDEVELECSVTYHGNIPPQMKWKKAGEGSSTSLEVSVVTSRNHFVSTLKIKGDIAMNNTSYVCETKRSSQGSSKCTSQAIKILYALTGNSTVNKTIDDEIHCNANTSQSSCIYEWKWLQDNDFTIESSTSVLKAKKAGWHRCEAECYLRNKSCNFLVMRTLVYGEAESSQMWTISILLSVVVTLVGLMVVSWTCIILYLRRIAWNKDNRIEYSAVIDNLNILTKNKQPLQKIPVEFGERADINIHTGVATYSDADKKKVHEASADSNTEEKDDLCQIDEFDSLSRLHLAAKRGYAEDAGDLLMSPTNVDALDAKHNTPLHYASLNGHVDFVNLLLSKGASGNTGNALGRTSLHLASKNGHQETVKLLLNSNAAVNAVCSNQTTSLHLAAKHGHADIVQILISNRANVNSCNKDKMTALHLACQHGHTSIASLLLNNKAIVDVTKQSQETPFYLAAKNGHAEISDLLLGHDVCDFVLTDYKETPLHAAVRNGHTEVVEVILKHSTKIYGKLIKYEQKLQENAQNLIGSSGIQSIQLFRSDGRQVSAGLVWTEENKPLEIWKNSSLETALDLAVLSTQTKIVQLLISTDQCTYSKDHLRGSFDCIITAIHCYKVANCRKNEETDVVRSDDEQYEKFCEDTKEIAQVLMNSINFNVNHPDHNGQTSLHKIMNDLDWVFSKPGNMIYMIYLIQLLLEKGADFNLKNSYGETPLIIASEKGCCDAIQILLDWGQKSEMKLAIDARDQYGETALIKAAERNHVSVVRLLLNHKASVNLHDYYGFTALHAVVCEPNTNWFDLYFFCKGLLKQNCGCVDSPETSSRKKFRFGTETVNPRTLIARLQSRLQINEETTRLREETVKLLLDYDETNVNAKDFRGNAPLDLALKCSNRINSEILKALKNRGAVRKSQEPEDLAPIEVARVDNRGRNPLHRLIISGTSDCIFEYWTSWTESKQDEEQFDFMVNGILLSPENFMEMAIATDNKRRTPLHYAVMSPSFYNFGKFRDLVRLLLEIGSGVNATDIYGKTPLHYAETDDQHKLLVHYGADENTKDNFGNKPKDCRQLRNLLTSNEVIASNWPGIDVCLFVDAGHVGLLDTSHVSELTRRKLVKAIHIHSQSRRPRESSERAVWKIWIENKFLLLNRRLSQLKPSVKHFIERLADGIKKKDWRFECQPILLGSAEEETTAIISADFDFNFKLMRFSELCDPFPHPLGPKGYFELRRKTNEDTKGLSDDQFACFFNFDHCLLTNEINYRFKDILQEVLSDPDLWYDEHLFDWNTHHKYSRRYGNIDGLCNTVRLRMIHPIEDGVGGFLFVKIFIDIVACIHVENWWPEDPLPVYINPTVKAYGCTFVFDRPHFDPSEPRGFIFSETFARISFTPIESRFIKESSLLIKAAYIICKMKLNFEVGTTYQLKNCLLFCMEAFRATNKSEARKETKITPKLLAFWVERIMFCFMQFSRRGIYPCYFMPSFRRRALQPPNAFRQCLEINAAKPVVLSENLRDIGYCAAYGLYLDLCPDGFTFDIPVNTQIDQQLSERRILHLNDDPTWLKFDREEFIRALSSRSPTEL